MYVCMILIKGTYMMSINVDRVEIFLYIGTVMVVPRYFIVVIPRAVIERSWVVVLKIQQFLHLIQQRLRTA